MKIYLVGGAVRDQLLQRPIKEKDWVVVGETQQSMLSAGFQQVGKDFPVFLHPKTKEEYALARKERKIAQGYHGFEFDTTTTVTLEEDLLRRDLTINALAQGTSGHIIDPYRGREDLQKKILRHVSPAFVEDPVRILRVARFAARFPDFTLAEETYQLMQKMVKAGEVNALVAERVWKEFEKAMSDVAPERFIDVLDDCGALNILFPLFKKCKHIILLQLNKIKSQTQSVFERMVLLLSSLSSSQEIKIFFEHYRVPKAIVEMVDLLINLNNRQYYDTPQELLRLFHRLDAFRRPERFKHWVALNRMNQYFSEQQSNFLLQLFATIEKIPLSDDFLAKNHGKAVGDYIEHQRLKLIIAQLPVRLFHKEDSDHR